MTSVTSDTEEREIPRDIAAKLAAWNALWRDSAKIHYAFGGLSVTASAVAATGGDYAQYLSAAAAVLTALIGFTHPERRYFKFVRPWRILDIAVLRYKLNLIELPGLVDAVERGEALLSEFEAKTESTTNEPASGTTRTVSAAPAPPEPGAE